MRIAATTVVALGLLVGCVRAPTRVVFEKRFHDSLFSGFSKRVISDAAPVADVSSVYFGTRNGKFYSVDPEKGDVRWSISARGPIVVPAVASEGKVYVGTSSGRFIALSAEDGRELWAFETQGEFIGPPAISGPLVVAGANDGFLYAFDRSTGALKWRTRFTLPDRITIRRIATPTGNGNTLYAGFSDGSVAAIRSSDGQIVWQRALSLQDRFPDVAAPIQSVDGDIWAQQFTGGLARLNAEGSEQVKASRGGTAAAPWIEKERIFYATNENQLVAAGVRSGETIWTFDAGQRANWSGIVGFGEWIAASTYDGWLYFLKQSDGSLVWKYSFGSPVMGPPLVWREKVFVLTGRGQLVAVAKRS